MSCMTLDMSLLSALLHTCLELLFDLFRPTVNSSGQSCALLVFTLPSTGQESKQAIRRGI